MSGEFSRPWRGKCHGAMQKGTPYLFPAECFRVRGMIYDCFVFYDELDLLEIRLNVLNDVVDKFVIVESHETFSQTSKPLFYQENKARFKDFEHKIINVIIDKFPRWNWKKMRPARNWDREDFQRNALSRGLAQCTSDDIIIFSDVDEIPRPEKIVEYKNTPGVKTFYQEMYYYYLNYLVVDHTEPNDLYNGYRPWHGTVMATYDYFRKSPNDVRTYRSRKDKDHTMVMDGGWHYSFMGGTEMVLKKLRAYAHTEYMDENTFNPTWIEEQMRLGKDVLNRRVTFKKIALEVHAPRYLVDNQEKYKHLLLP